MRFVFLKKSHAHHYCHHTPAYQIMPDKRPGKDKTRAEPQSQLPEASSEVFADGNIRGAIWPQCEFVANKGRKKTMREPRLSLPKPQHNPGSNPARAGHGALSQRLAARAPCAWRHTARLAHPASRSATANSCLQLPKVDLLVAAARPNDGLCRVKCNLVDASGVTRQCV